jgi:hypothetical protein
VPTRRSFIDNTATARSFLRLRNEQGARAFRGKSSTAKETVMRFVWGFLSALLLIAIAAFAVTYSGAYNVAANVPDTAGSRPT